MTSVLSPKENKECVHKEVIHSSHHRAAGTEHHGIYSMTLHVRNRTTNVSLTCGVETSPRCSQGSAQNDCCISHVECSYGGSVGMLSQKARIVWVSDHSAMRSGLGISKFMTVSRLSCDLRSVISIITKRGRFKSHMAKLGNREY